MCDYSLGIYASRAAEVGDRLTISSHTHGFATVADNIRAVRADDSVRLTCIKEVGTVLRLTVGWPAYRGAVAPDGLSYGQSFEGKFVKIEGTSRSFRDALTIGNEQVLIAYLPKGTTATVMSIPSVTAAKAAKKAAAKARAKAKVRALARAEAKAAEARKAKRAAVRKPKKQSLEVRLGLDKLNAKVTKGKDPKKVTNSIRRSARRVTARA